MPEPRPDANPAAARALGFDVLEWFHDEVLRAQLSRRHWRRLPTRVSIGVDRALGMCAQHGVRATFFVLGAIAERDPELVRRIAAAGHELASLGWLPHDLDAATADERLVRQGEWERARQQIEAICGKAVRGLRSPWRHRGSAQWQQIVHEGDYAFDASGDAWQIVPVWQLDAEQPRLVGLPSHVLRAHHAPLDRAAADLARMLAAGGRAPIGEVLGVPAGPAPRREVVAAQPAPSARAVPADLPRLALIVPLKDEAAGLESLAMELDALRERLAHVARWEFVFVDDGSTDRTWALLQELFGGRDDARFVQHEKNRGVSAAIRSGVLATDAPLIASIDGDLSYDPLELERMVPLLAGADVITASPYHPAGGVKNVPPWRLSLSRTLSWCYRRLLRSQIHTWTSCFRVYRRAAVVDLPNANPGFLGTAELLVRVLRRGGVVREHPCVLEARLFGLSKMKILRTIRGHVHLLWQVARGRIG